MIRLRDLLAQELGKELNKLVENVRWQLTDRHGWLITLDIDPDAELTAENGVRLAEGLARVRERLNAVVGLTLDTRSFHDV